MYDTSTKIRKILLVLHFSVALTPGSYGISLLPYMGLSNLLESLSLRFFHCKLRIVLPASQGYWEDHTID